MYYQMQFRAEVLASKYSTTRLKLLHGLLFSHSRILGVELYLHFPVKVLGRQWMM